MTKTFHQLFGHLDVEEIDRRHPIQTRSGFLISPAQWVGLLRMNGQWLTPCCAEISKIRSLLAKALHQDETLSLREAWDLCWSASHHDMLGEVFGGKVSDNNPFNHPASPWPVIVTVCREVLGEEAYVSATERSPT